MFRGGDATRTTGEGGVVGGEWGRVRAQFPLTGEPLPSSI